MRRSLLLIPVVAVLVGGLVACTDQAPGQPLPQTTRSTGSGSGGPFTTGPTKTSVSQPDVPASPLKDVDPCSLLSAPEVADLRAGPGKKETLNNARACLFHEAEGFSTSVAIFDGLGLDDIVASGPITPVPTVGKHKAVQRMGGIRTCAISIEVTKTSRVDALGTVGTDEKKSCDLALRVAKLVEPRLP